MINKLSSMKNRFFTIVLVLLSLFANKVSASHVAACDLYVDFIGNHPNDLRYRVTIVLFKACETGNAGLGTTAQLSVSSSCYTLSPCSFNLPMTQGPDTLDQLCDTFKAFNTCRQPGSQYPGFERRIYSDTLTLPGACTDWKFSWNLCCRNMLILNLTNPSSDGMYIECTLNNAAKWNCSSPRFLIDPIPYLCVNQPAFFLNGPFDPNNDSLYSLNSNPQDLGTSSGCATTGINIGYQPGFSLSLPLTCTPATYTVNSNTATAMFTPSAIGKYVLAFKCNKYDRTTGTLLSSIMRDVQLSVLNCNAPPPSIDSIPMNVNNGYIATSPSGDKYVVAAPDCQLKFDVSGSSNSFTNKLYMSCNNSSILPSSSFTVANQGSQSPTGTFTWTPTVSDIGDYTLIVAVKDSTCNTQQPIVLPNFLVVFIKVVPIVNAGPDGKICKIDGQPWQFNVTGPNNVPYTWTALGGGTPIGISDPNIKNPSAYPPYNFTYVVSTPAIPAGCHGTDTVNIIIDTSNSLKATPKDAVVCRPGYMQIDAEGIGNPPLLNMSCGTTNPLNCSTPDTVDVVSQAVNTVQLNTNIQTPFPSFRTSRIQILITRKDLYDYGMKPGTLKGLAFNITTASPTLMNNFKILMACTDRRTINAQTGSFESGTVPVYAAPGPVSLATSGWNWFTFDTPYNWDSTKNLIVEICYSNAATGTAAAVSALSTPSEAMAMAYANTGSANICVNPTISSGTIYYSVRPEIKFSFCKAPYDVFHFTWFPGRYLSDSTSSSPLAFIDKSTKFYVTSLGGNGCKIEDSISLKVPIHDYGVWPKDTSFCYGDVFKAIASGGFNNVTWWADTTLSKTNPSLYTPVDLDCNNCATVIGKPNVSTNYYAVMADADGCGDTMVVHAIVKPLPNVHIINNDTTIKYGQSIQMLVSGAYLYSWQPMSSLTNPNIVNPYANPTEPTTYIVYGIGENGCRNQDSVHVNIDYRDNLFVPSAFTPNGDGKNDVFKVANLTFQRLMEFRVFNRWGQELFSTNDPRKGWDGSWKGVPQDMGVYQYLIRVGYPDGYVETYQGNVTLVR